MPEEPEPSVPPFWFERPRAERAAAALQHEGVGIESLALGTRAHNCLVRSRWFANVGELMLAGDSIWELRNMGIVTLCQIDDALAPLFEQASTGTAAAEFEGDEAQRFERSMRRLAGLGPVEDGAWYEMPMGPRAVVADRYRDEAWGSLGLHPETEAVLRGLPNLQSIGALFGVGPFIARSPKFEPAVVADLHRRLVAFARAVVDGLDATEQWRVLESVASRAVGLDARDLADRWAAKNATILPEGYRVGGDMSMSEALTLLLRQVVLDRLDEREWAILQHRSELGGAPKLTLQQLGDEYGVTRERIRQREKTAMWLARTWSLRPDDPSQPARPHPALVSALQDLVELFAEVARTPHLETELTERAGEILGQPSTELDPLVILLAELHGLAEIRFGRKGLEPLWAADDPGLRDRIRLRVTQLHDHLTGLTSHAIGDVELARAINAEADGDSQISLAEIHRYAGYCSTIEGLPDGRYQGRFEALAGRMLQVERILTLAGRPLHLSEIQRRINDHADQHGGRRMRILNLSNQMTHHAALVPIGRSGYWALADWTDIETGTVLELMERCLVEHDRPMRPAEIFAWVVQRRPVGKASILAFLTMADRFAKVDSKRWGLEHWPEVREARAWNRQGVAEFVARYFQEEQAQVLPYAQLRDAICEAAEVDLRVANGLLNSNPVIRSINGPDGRLMVRLQPDYREQIEGPGGLRTRPVKPRVREHAKRVLEAVPDRTMPLPALRDILMQEMGVSAFSVYRCIARIDELETLPWPGERGKLVRWVDPPATDEASTS